MTILESVRRGTKRLKVDVSCTLDVEVSDVDSAMDDEQFEIFLGESLRKLITGKEIPLGGSTKISVSENVDARIVKDGVV